MYECDLSTWVEQEENPTERKFREAVHTILFAIGHSQNIAAQMIMKGAILLAIRYNCIRYTTDIDFSTSITRKEFDEIKFFSDLDECLVTATETLDYGLACRVQSHEYKPPGKDRSFPTLKIRIGYAYKGDQKNQKRLLSKKSLDVVEIDYSFNEATYNLEDLVLKNGGKLLAYSYIDLIAEKYRAILQQHQRNRSRRQDIFDLYYLFTHGNPPSRADKHKILDSLIKKAAAREITADRLSMRDPEIIRRSKHEYHNLKSEIIGDLPEFDTAYNHVQSFYESLPWE